VDHAATRLAGDVLTRLRYPALVVLISLAGASCAGEVGKYRNAAPLTDSPTTVPTGPTAAPVGSVDSVPPLTTTPTGPAARLSERPDHGTATGRTPTAEARGTAAPATAVTAQSGPTDGQGAAQPVASAPVPVPADGPAVGLTKDAITVGLFYPKTGPYAAATRNVPALTEAAFAEAGPINGRRVVVKYYDDGTTNPSTIQAEEKRAKDEVFQYVSLSGESNVVLAPLADRHRVPLVIGNIDQKVALPLTYAFAVFAYWAHQAKLLPGFIKNVLGAADKKIGIVYDSTSTAIDAKNVFKDKAKELGLNIIFEQPIAQTQSACVNEVSNLQARGVELVFMMNGPLGAICMLRDARALGYKPKWTGVGVSWGFNAVAQVSAGAADGIRLLRTTPTLESPQGRHYSEVMRRALPDSGADTDDILLTFYSVLVSAIEGLRRAGPDLTRESLVRTWETKMNGYDSGYLPPPTFGPGNRSGPLEVGITACCTNGKWTTPQPGWRATF
jgi:ABC-type branched-subunit amino acid transport system substrate-binding protein